MADPQTDQQARRNEVRMPGTVGNVRLFGIPVRLHFTFVLLLVFLIVIGIGGKQTGAATAVYIVGCLPRCCCTRSDTCW